MYTTSWCGYCFRLKTLLKAEGIRFAEVDIEADPAAAEFVASVNGGNQTVPTLKFADGSTLTNPSGAEVKAKLARYTSSSRSTKWRLLLALLRPNVGFGESGLSPAPPRIR